jgi:hypothetical protein
MKILLMLTMVLAAVAGMIVEENLALGPAQQIPRESKVQPKEVTLGQDSQSDKYGVVPFNHETHSLKMYNIDGKSVIPCEECHHTDQPKAALKPPLVTSERDVVLTTAALVPADAKPVKSCRFCHLQIDDDSATMPVVTYPGKTTPTKLTNEFAYHQNCNVCHDKAIAARPVLKGKIPGAQDCIPCHKPIS